MRSVEQGPFRRWPQRRHEGICRPETVLRAKCWRQLVCLRCQNKMESMRRDSYFSIVFLATEVVLFPWQARLYDRDVASAAPEKAENPAGHGSKEVKGKTHTYYQVLIDARDCPHISQRSQTEAVTFLANHDDSRALYAIPGLTMSAMKTSSPTPPRIRFPSSMSSLRDSFSMTRQKPLPLWLERRSGPGKRRITHGWSSQTCTGRRPRASVSPSSPSTWA